MIDENDVNIADRKLILLARIDVCLVNDFIFPQVEINIEKNKNKISNNEKWRKAIQDFNSIKTMTNCLFFFHDYAYADILLNKKYDAIGLLDKDFIIDNESYVVCESYVLSFLMKQIIIPMESASSGHNGFCVIHFPNEIPKIIYELPEIKEELRIEATDIVKKLCLCTYETFASSS